MEKPSARLVAQVNGVLVSDMAKILNLDGGGAMNRPLIAAALEEFRVELKARVGFHAMTATKGAIDVWNPR